MDVGTVSSANARAGGNTAASGANTSREARLREAAEAEARQQAAEQQARQSSGDNAVPYFSPILRYDQPSNVLIFQYRDFQTGDVTRQIPAERVVERYRTAAQAAGEEGATGAQGEGRSPNGSSNAQGDQPVRIFGQGGGEGEERSGATRAAGGGGQGNASTANPSRVGSGAVSGSDSPSLRITA